MREVSAHKKEMQSECYRLSSLLRDPISKMKVSALSSRLMAERRDGRLKKVSSATTNRDISLISHVINVARKEWGIHTDNPIAMICRPPESRGRNRRLVADEEQTCTNPCRWDYKVHPAQEDASGDIYLLEEGQRPNGQMPIEEDMHGTYIMNSKDLRAIEHVEKLTAMGIESFKIEGRTKSPYYVACTCQSYRAAIDDAAHGRPFNPALLGRLEGLLNRGYTDGFYQRHHGKEYQLYLRGFSLSGRSIYVGEELAIDASLGRVKIDVKNRFAVGDKLEIIEPAGNQDVVLQEMRNLAGEAIRIAPGSGHVVWVTLPVSDSKAFIARYTQSDNPSKLEQNPIVERRSTRILTSQHL